MFARLEECDWRGVFELVRAHFEREETSMIDFSKIATVDVPTKEARSSQWKHAMGIIKDLPVGKAVCFPSTKPATDMASAYTRARAAGIKVGVKRTPKSIIVWRREGATCEAKAV
jgi:hypothetical protein